MSHIKIFTILFMLAFIISPALAAGQTIYYRPDDYRNATTSNSTISLDAVYPIGSIYITTVDINPAILFGVGTWERVSMGRVLIGQDDTSFPAPQSTGGNYTVPVSMHRWWV